MSYIPRQLEKDIKPFLKRKEFLAILGARQVGKTTLLKHMAGQLEKNEKVKYITFEKKADLELFNDIENFKKIHEDYQRVIIDEFQYSDNGGQKLKYLFDTGNTKYIVLSSSSLDIKFQTGSYMVGRLMNFHLWPFSFREYLFYKDKDLHQLLTAKASNILSSNFSFKKELFGEEINQRLNNYLEDYLIYGGYPQVVLTKSKKERQKVLEEISESYLTKEIRNLLQLATDNELWKLTQFLSTQIGNLVEYNKLSNVSGLSYKKLLEHLEILRKTYIIDLIRPYYTSKRTELSKNPKVYFIDSGLRNLVISDFRKLDKRKDTGSLAENHVFMWLKRTNGNTRNINFWRTKSKAEVDFIIQKENKVIPLEVKYQSNPRVGKSLHSFIDKFSPPEVFILTKETFKKEKIKGTDIKFIPVCYL